MTQPNPPQPLPYGQTNVYITPQPSNGLGVAGFITSLVGIPSCGLLSPIGLLLSFFALFRRPRGFAIAGVVIGLFGTVLMAVWGLGFALMLIGIKQGVQTAAQSFETGEGAGRAYTLIEKSRQETGSLPDDSIGTELISSQRDAWDNSYRYKKAGEDSFVIISSGSDGEFDTGDDAKFYSEEFRIDRPATRPTTAPIQLPGNPPADIPTH